MRRYRRSKSVHGSGHKINASVSSSSDNFSLGALFASVYQNQQKYQHDQHRRKQHQYQQGRSDTRGRMTTRGTSADTLISLLGNPGSHRQRQSAQSMRRARSRQQQRMQRRQQYRRKRRTTSQRRRYVRMISQNAYVLFLNMDQSHDSW